MTFVIGDACIGTTDRSCIDVCPVACIYEVGTDENDPDQPYMLVIDAEECIDCGACEPECPVEAISIDSMVPTKWEPFVTINAMHTGRGGNDGPAEERRDDHVDIIEAAKKAHEALQSV